MAERNNKGQRWTGKIGWGLLDRAREGLARREQERQDVMRGDMYSESDRKREEIDRATQRRR
jgi:hypothetical protein